MLRNWCVYLPYFCPAFRACSCSLYRCLPPTDVVSDHAIPSGCRMHGKLSESLTFALLNLRLPYIYLSIHYWLQLLAAKVHETFGAVPCPTIPGLNNFDVLIYKTRIAPSSVSPLAVTHDIRDPSYTSVYALEYVHSTLGLTSTSPFSRRAYAMVPNL